MTADRSFFIHFFLSLLFKNDGLKTSDSDGTCSATSRQILDVLAAKYWAIRYATGAAVNVLSVDSIIMVSLKSSSLSTNITSFEL